MRLSIYNPNLSVIMPVGCNCKCKFCCWQESSGLTTNRFKFVCNTLPDMFKQCSITGGEPTLCGQLQEYIAIAKLRFEKVVLNTNGYKLTNDIVTSCDFVNISRHHYLDEKNKAIFNCESVPSAADIKQLSKFGNVTLNCLLPSGFNDLKFIEKYICFAKWVGSKVAFRKYYSDIEILSVDSDKTLIGSHSCGACLHRWHKINGVDVTFEYSGQETFEKMDGIYELILQSNGDLTFDWQGKNKLIYKWRMRNVNFRPFERWRYGRKFCYVS